MIQLHIKYIFQLLTISCILTFFCFLHSNKLSGAETEDATLAEVINSDVQTLFKDTVLLDSLLTDNLNIIVFYHNYTCIDCYKKIAKEINAYKNEGKEINLIVLLRFSSFNKDRKDLYKKAKKLLHTENIYFDIHSKEDNWPPVDLEEGIFSKFPILQTPAVLFISNSKSKMEFRSYADLFQREDSTKPILELVK